MLSIHIKPTDRSPAQPGTFSKKEDLSLKPTFLESGSSDPVLLKKLIRGYCRKYGIRLNSKLPSDFGAALLKKGNGVLKEAAERGEGEVVKYLLETPRRLLLQEKTKRVSKPHLNASGKKDDKWRYAYLENMRLFRVGECSKEVFKQVVAEKENWDSILSLAEELGCIYASLKDEFIGLFLENLFLAVDLPAFDTDQHLSLAKRAISQGATEAVIEKIDLFAPELKERFFLFQWFLRENEAAIAMKHIEAFRVDLWTQEDWLDALELAKNHIKGVDLAKRIPERFKNQQIQKLVQECEESRSALEKVAGVIWRPISRRFDPESNGYFITFESNSSSHSMSKEERELYREKVRDSFPAVESSTVRLFPIAEEIGFNWVEKREGKGVVSQRGALLTLPEVPVVIHRYERLRKKKQELPEFSIYPCSGILGDEEFLSKVVEHHVVCSTDKELVHDLTVHFLHTLEFMLHAPQNYSEFRLDWTSKFKKAKECLDASRGQIDPDTYEQLLFMLSFSADGYSALEYQSYFLYGTLALESLPAMYFKEPDSYMKGYLDRTFGEKFKGYESLNEAWQKVLGNKKRKRESD